MDEDKLGFMAEHSKLTDQELTLLLPQGDGPAFTEIFNRYNTLLYKHAYKILGDYEEASDVVQELFFTLWEKRAELKFKSSLSSYLYTALRNRIFDFIAHQKVADRYLSSIQEFVKAGYYQADQEMLTKELAQIIEREIAALPTRMREIFELSRKEEMSYREIGQVLGISEGTVKLQVHNATKILKTKINSFLVLLPFL